MPTPTALELAPLAQDQRSSPETLVQALKNLEALDGLSHPEYLWLAENGSERRAAPGIMLFREGDPPAGMIILLSGEVHVRRAQAGSMSYFIARVGQLSGLLPFSRMKGMGGNGYSVGEVWSIDIPKALFADMLVAIPSMAQRCVTILLNRVREVTRIELQAEKLTALGKLAANLAHELNNPASAAQRSAASLFGELRTFGDNKQRLGGALVTAEQYDQYQDWVTRTRARMSDYMSRGPLPRTSLELSDREDIFRVWAEAHNIPEAWTIASAIAESPMTIAHLDELASIVSPETLAISAAAFASSLRVERMAETVMNSTVRIFDFISAIKDYSYMDQAPIQEVDVAQALDNTLAMLASRLQHVEIKREYDPDLPHISGFGSELNQVWTELIANALDAMQDCGTLRLKTSVLGQMVVIEVWNSGPQIEPDVLSRIFEPFYTTKPVGQGLGLGLDSVMRIVSLHSGVVTVDTRPGATCFQVRLPIERAEAY